MVLMGYVDDATGSVFARFYPSEDLPAALDSFRRYCQRYGIPQSVYLDKHTIYRSPGPTNLQNQLEGKVCQSQFEGALSELAVRVIHANSPQAKGRVERLFKTFQDRLVKELRLAGVRTLAEANQFLEGFLPAYNRHFSRAPRQAGNLHRQVSSGLLERALCAREPRVVANDGTIQIQKWRLQLRSPSLRSLAKKRVTVTISLKGQLRVLDQGRELPYRLLPLQPPRREPEPAPSLRRGGWGFRGWRPPADHPWRKKACA